MTRSSHHCPKINDFILVYFSPTFFPPTTLLTEQKATTIVIDLKVWSPQLCASPGIYRSERGTVSHKIEVKNLEMVVSYVVY